MLDKQVDEKWMEAIENTIPAIYEIIGHPRRFLKTIENLVPVEQVKKISTDTVRHLASHTQFISGVQSDGSLVPSKLLTVENDESMDLYENRFVNTLIQKLGEFIERRVGAIFWDTGDEEYSILRMESNIEDDYESVDYKLEMTVKNKQTYLENDSGKMEIFKRIDRIRRIISDFRSSTFCQVMNGTAPVRPPIQRTNQIIKNPEYRKCYDLWQFLERYDDVGYQIDVRETALDFDEDYLFQMYGNLALTYTVFKSLLEKDTRRVTEQPKRRKTVKPKFVKQIVEEFVDDYDIPDVEIRRVIVEEVTKAQLEIERRTKEKEKEREQKALEAAKEKERQAKLREKEKEKARKAREAAKEKERLAKQREREREKARKAREAAKEKERQVKLREREKEKARKAREAAREKERLAKQREQGSAKKPKNTAPKAAAASKETLKGNETAVWNVEAEKPGASALTPNTAVNSPTSEEPVPAETAPSNETAALIKKSVPVFESAAAEEKVSVSPENSREKEFVGKYKSGWSRQQLQGGVRRQRPKQ